MSDSSLHISWEAPATVVYTDGLSDVRDPAAAQGPASHSDPALLDLETVYRIRRPELIRYLARFGVDLVEAEDITQEVFLNIFGRAQNQEIPDNPFRWALVCAKNLAINRYRRRLREVPAPASVWKQWEATIPDSRPSAEFDLQEEERYRKLTEWVSTLSDFEQKCAVMRSQGLPFREMAVALELPMRKVIYITSVAIQKLKILREGQAL
jgi:RNA polymerase sigma-70 factor (ECF subfamily)